MSTVYYDNINGFSQLKMENSRLYGRLNSGEWTEIETGGEQGEPGADGLSAYVYIAWCSDPATGANFSLTTPADYIAFLSTNTQLASPQFGQFSHWAKYIGEDGTDGASTYVYYAYASDADGTNFSLSPADGLNYQAILVTHTELVSPSLADFVGLFYQYKTDLSAYLPLSGGTMTGNVDFDMDSFISIAPKSNTSSYTIIRGGTSNTNGARLTLCGVDYANNHGGFVLSATDGTETCELSGTSTGNLTWRGVSVLNPIGTVIAFAGNSAPAGYLICNGAAVSRTTYAKLFAIIGTTYGAGDGSTTFNLPNLTNKFIMGSGTAGTNKAAGLPNISGSFDVRKGASNANTNLAMTFKESFYSSSSSTVTPTVAYAVTSVDAYTPQTINFDASRASSVYKDDVTTVQPPALTMRFYIKY